MNGFIYIMSNPTFGNRIKIGKSKGDPSSFRKDDLYSTGVPEPFKVESDLINIAKNVLEDNNRLYDYKDQYFF